MKYNKDYLDKLLKSLQDGDGRVRACKNANISYQTFMNWLEKVEFVEAVKKAEAVGDDFIKHYCLRKILDASSWQSAAWLLERRYPAEFALKYEANKTPITTETIKELATILNGINIEQSTNK